jgi:hypothetical protein
MRLSVMASFSAHICVRSDSILLQLLLGDELIVGQRSIDGSLEIRWCSRYRSRTAATAIGVPHGIPANCCKPRCQYRRCWHDWWLGMAAGFADILFLPGCRALPPAQTSRPPRAERSLAARKAGRSRRLAYELSERVMAACGGFHIRRLAGTGCGYRIANRSMRCCRFRRCWLFALISRFGHFDEPNARSLHERPVPRTGGIAVLLGGSGVRVRGGAVVAPAALALALAACRWSMTCIACRRSAD